MSDRMTPIPFKQLIDWILIEKEKYDTLFDVRHPYFAKGKSWKIFNRKLETVIGPAAGPHTQLAQNLIASYYTGSRFFELKTVQKLDGEDLPVAKPCIKADDECYNCEWSTELYVPQAMAEYIKAWILIKVIAKEYNLGAMDGFQFNMSVGYDLDGIKTEKINNFIETLKDASNNEVFIECKKILLENIDRFKNVTKADIDSIEPKICNSVTLSTLHGCPPAEIERIASYLITEKGLNTFIKCNPTLLGYEFARSTMDNMGYDYMAFGDFHFKDDLQWNDAIPMLERLMSLAQGKGLQFGVKITNTFPVDVKQGELPSEEMYMSGKALFPLSITLAARLTKQFNGKLRISYSGGADYYNLKEIVDAGIWPVTMATTMLKTGGYQRIEQMARLLEDLPTDFNNVSVEKTEILANSAYTNKRHIKAVKPLPSRKINKSVPLSDCFIAPCRNGCPIHQDITRYMQLSKDEKYEEALFTILDKNPLPFITGTICPHTCQNKCTRSFYEDSVHIRDMKLISANGGYDKVINKISMAPIISNKRVAIIGGGPAGLAAAYFIRKNGIAVTIFEKESSLGGVVKHVIPSFRISDESIDNDVTFITAQGVDIVYNKEIKNISELKNQGYDYVILAIGAHLPGVMPLDGDAYIDALEFLHDFKKENGKLNIGEDIVVIGGGNTAMDTARAAKRVTGVKNVRLVYRRTKRYMPADEEELLESINDGVDFMELLAPISYKNKILVCEKMKLSDIDASGRRGVEKTGEFVEIKADTLIAAVGENIDVELFKANKINVNDRGRALLNSETLESSNKGVYLVGDCMKGPATVVEAIADATKVANAIVGKNVTCEYEPFDDKEHIYSIKGILDDAHLDRSEGDRCLNCATVCESCVEVCPNRANVSVNVKDSKMHQIVHVDYMCNECGNCKSFCPYDSAPYKDKLTLFANVDDFNNSENQGFVMLNDGMARIRYLGEIHEIDINKEYSFIESGVIEIMRAVVADYAYML